MPPEWVPPISGVEQVWMFPCEDDLTVKDLVRLISEQLRDDQVDASRMLIKVFTDAGDMLTGIFTHSSVPTTDIVLVLCALAGVCSPCSWCRCTYLSNHVDIQYAHM